MIGALALFLAACAAPANDAIERKPIGPPTAERKIAVVVARPVNPARAGAAVGAGQDRAVVEPQAPAAVVRQPAPPKDAVIEPLPDPTELLGLDRLQVAKLLGSPSLLMEEPPAEVWLYEGNLCVLHLFLYESAENPDYAVRYFEVRGSGDIPVAEEICYASLLDEVPALLR